jgi:hypothetical protein
MDASEFLRKTKLESSIQQMHQAITEKFPIENIPFDAWYTNRCYVMSRLSEVGHSVAGEIRKEFLEKQVTKWSEDIPEPLRSVLERAGTLPAEWEDTPDGMLAGVAIVAAGWVANQAAAKTRDNPENRTRELFEEHVRPLILASMNLGIKMAEDEKKP